MDRRQILKLTAMASGSVVAAPIVASLLSGCNPNELRSASADGLHFFTNREFELIGRVLDILIPETDSPSATEVGVHHIIDAMVGTVYKDAARQNYRKEFESLSAHLDSAQDLAGAIIELNEKRGDETVLRAYRNLKQQCIAYYLSTEEIGTTYLNHLAVPGEYLPCIGVDEVGNKAWTQ